MVKGCKELVSSLVLEHRNSFETNREYSIRSYRVYGKTIKSKLYEDDSEERFFHIYFNPSKQAAERVDSLSARLLELQKTKQEIEAKKVMDAFRKSGKSIQELMTFLEV